MALFPPWVARAGPDRKGGLAEEVVYPRTIPLLGKRFRTY
jgi:hypothetical protein